MASTIVDADQHALMPSAIAGADIRLSTIVGADIQLSAITGAGI